MGYQRRVHGNQSNRMSLSIMNSSNRDDGVENDKHIGLQHCITAALASNAEQHRFNNLQLLNSVYQPLPVDQTTEREANRPVSAEQAAMAQELQRRPTNQAWNRSGAFASPVDLGPRGFTNTIDLDLKDSEQPEANNRDPKRWSEAAQREISLQLEQYRANRAVVGHQQTRTFAVDDKGFTVMAGKGQLSAETADVVPLLDVLKFLKTTFDVKSDGSGKILEEVLTGVGNEILLLNTMTSALLTSMTERDCDPPNPNEVVTFAVKETTNMYNRASNEFNKLGNFLPAQLERLAGPGISQDKLHEYITVAYNTIRQLYCASNAHRYLIRFGNLKFDTQVIREFEEVSIWTRQEVELPQRLAEIGLSLFKLVKGVQNQGTGDWSLHSFDAKSEKAQQDLISYWTISFFRTMSHLMFYHPEGGKPYNKPYNEEDFFKSVKELNYGTWGWGSKTYTFNERAKKRLYASFGWNDSWVKDWKRYQHNLDTMLIKDTAKRYTNKHAPPDMNRPLQNCEWKTKFGVNSKFSAQSGDNNTNTRATTFTRSHSPQRLRHNYDAVVAEFRSRRDVDQTAERGANRPPSAEQATMAQEPPINPQAITNQAQNRRGGAFACPVDLGLLQGFSTIDLALPREQPRGANNRDRPPNSQTELTSITNGLKFF